MLCIVTPKPSTYIFLFYFFLFFVVQFVLFYTLIYSSFVYWQATGLSNVALVAYCKFFPGGQKKYTHFKSHFHKKVRVSSDFPVVKLSTEFCMGFTAGTWLDLCPSNWSRGGGSHIVIPVRSSWLVWPPCGLQPLQPLQPLPQTWWH